MVVEEQDEEEDEDEDERDDDDEDDEDNEDRKALAAVMAAAAVGSAATPTPPLSRPPSWVSSPTGTRCCSTSSRSMSSRSPSGYSTPNNTLSVYGVHRTTSPSNVPCPTKFLRTKRPTSFAAAEDSRCTDCAWERFRFFSFFFLPGAARAPLLDDARCRLFAFGRLAFLAATLAHLPHGHAAYAHTRWPRHRTIVS